MIGEGKPGSLVAQTDAALREANAAALANPLPPLCLELLPNGRLCGLAAGHVERVGSDHSG